MTEYKGAYDQVILQDVLSICSTYIIKPESTDLIKKAYDFIIAKHEGQKRKSGEPYTTRLIWVAYILSTLEIGPITIAAGLLHDIMKDCDVPHEEMVERFGEEITALIKSVTKVNKIPFKDEADVYVENHRKIYIAVAKDIRVVLVKLVDRLHNMRTLEYMRPDKQQCISRETPEVYTPITHHLGINDIRIGLGGLCLYYLSPKTYKGIPDLLEEKHSGRRESVDKMMQSVKQLSDENHIDYRMKSRAKHIYSVYKKMIIKHKRFDELYDLNASHIILKDRMKCYGVLDIIHDHYRPLPGRFRDYIAIPEPSMYQPLHTAITDEGGHIFEIQI